MKNRLISLINRTMDLSIEDARKATIVEMILQNGSPLDKNDCLFRQFAQDYTRDIIGDYIECGGLKWALHNAGTDDENPNGLLYTHDDALTLENDTWRLPTRNEQDMFLERTYYGFDKNLKAMIFIDRETGAKLILPAVGHRDNSSGTLSNNGTYGYYWASGQYNASNAYYMYFDSSNVDTNYYSKAYGRSVRLIRR